MVTQVLMPQAETASEEGTIVTWILKEGSTVNEGDILLEVETEKAVLEVPSPATGILIRILHQEGETIKVGETLATIADRDEKIPEEALASQPVSSETEKTAIEPSSPNQDASARTERIMASPAAKKMAREHGIKLCSISGTGPGGRIVEADVLTHLNSTPASSPGVSTPTEQGKRVPLTPLRIAIAKALVASKQNIPHFYLTVEVDVTRLHQAHLDLKPQGVSITAFIIQAVAKALREVPEVNSRLDGETQVFQNHINIGIAVDVEGGIRVPVLLDADRLSLSEIAEKSRDLVKQAWEGKAAGAGKGTFTISNLGMYGITEFSAIINPPEVAILAVGSIIESPDIKNGKISSVKKMKLTLSCDHRVFDGVTGARFLSKLKGYLEDL